MYRYIVYLNGRAIAHYKSMAACEKFFDKKTEELTKEYGEDGWCLQVYEVQSGAYYGTFPLTQENVEEEY